MELTKILRENQEKVEDFLNKIPEPCACLAEKYFGRKNITPRDRAKTVRGKAYVRSRFAKIECATIQENYLRNADISQYNN